MKIMKNETATCGGGFTIQLRRPKMNVVELEDVLSAMAESLLEKVPKAFNPVLKFQDQKIKFKIGGKPPREIFYRKTLTFMTQLPSMVPPKLCSCQFLCEGVPATIKCHSCSIYSPTNAAFYCNACFTARHPWYRVPHLYTSIEQDESVEHTLKIAHRISEAARFEKEGDDLMKSLQNEKKKLHQVADDLKVDEQIKQYGRRSTALEEYVLHLREQLQHDITYTPQQLSRKNLITPNTSNKPNTKQIKNNNEQQQQQPQHDMSLFNNSSIETLASIPTSPSSATIASMTTTSYIPYETILQQRLITSGNSSATRDNPLISYIQYDPDAPPQEEEEEEEKEQVVVIEQQQTNSKSQPNMKASLSRSSSLKFLSSAMNISRANSMKPNTNTATKKAQINAAITIQRIFRGYIGRRIVSQMMTMRIVRVWSIEYGRGNAISLTRFIVLI
jgi:hypothetical protein